MLYYLNTSYTDVDVVNFKMSSSVPPGIQWKMFLMDLGVKFDTVLPMERSQLLGYASLTYNSVTRTVKIRQVIR